MHYIVMEYVEGITLKTYIEKKGQLTFKEAVSIAIQVGRGIEAAHNKGIIHRDIKPQNIIISTEGKSKSHRLWYRKSRNIQHDQFRCDGICSLRIPGRRETALWMARVTFIPLVS